ncbi:LOW QUALITY PROTEIN: E3 ubiquitin/ISG15 ligase TRIM25-like [Ammospiza nelsoni]|uniref:LOW QUALITY PROTEIN: E3 ubiquitin/ISG15 ligase TRIM25-like n=1 Tax=Ammospiza caudacuta TaxID=2857398 RepID=UPI00273974D3|nr:LOW QUALITY PROTEIN: E3 ubiquitin/ISG15 ligase TRIM25-like [Ammospiza caudacuta]XP_059339345.1 LOW QUALITY PROTEIN: E3 ubiquitin/ISG15 ligase TRIM25-like [Ammospiza nelsoni]
MAQARQGCGGAGILEAELTCPICLELYREPMALSCGHNFCRLCIEEALYFQALWTCPTCMADLGVTLELHNNFKLRNIVEAFKAITFKARRESLQQDEGAEKGKTDVVACEQCLDEPQPAVKTCLICEASLCQAHLSKHNARAFHQERILVEVGAGKEEERRCRDHGKLLECYCLREEKCLCVLCSMAGAHKGHEVITMKEGHDRELVGSSSLPMAPALAARTEESRRKGEAPLPHGSEVQPRHCPPPSLRRSWLALRSSASIMTDLQESKSDLVTALEELQKRENQIKNNTKTLTSDLKKLFRSIKAELDKKQTMILSDIQSYKEADLAVVTKARKEMEQKRDQAEQNLQALQMLKEQPDIFLFLRSSWIARLDLVLEDVKVEAVQLNDRLMIQYETQKKKFLLQLDSVLDDVRGARPCPALPARSGAVLPGPAAGGRSLRLSVCISVCPARRPSVSNSVRPSAGRSQPPQVPGEPRANERQERKMPMEAVRKLGRRERDPEAESECGVES